MTDVQMVDVPGFTLRALHSGWTDWMLDAPEEVRDAILQRCAGASFQRFALSLMSQRLVIVNRLDGDDMQVGVGVPVVDAEPWVLFWLRESQTGLTWSLVVGMATSNLDDELAELLAGE